MDTRPGPRTCVHPSGRFVYGIHRPSYKVPNLRATDAVIVLGHDEQGGPVVNQSNFPEADLEIKDAQWVYEVPNPFPFWGTTYILKNPADKTAATGKDITFRPMGPRHQDSEFLRCLAKGEIKDSKGKSISIADLPRDVHLALAQCSRDPEVLKALCRLSCRLEYDKAGNATGMVFKSDESSMMRPVVLDHDLFEVLGNNPALPYDHKLAMVLNPGAQGTSPIVGEYTSEPRTHIWEYLRANSYVPWGHWASNMAQDAVRYSVKDLSLKDVSGLRHLYYQRVFVQMAQSLEIIGESLPKGAPSLSEQALEKLRKKILEKIIAMTRSEKVLPFTATLWGWNYGYDFSSSGYRMHASHQQIHHQFALIPPKVTACDGLEPIATYAIGDQVASFCRDYQKTHGTSFFSAYIQALETNTRMDDRRDLSSELVILKENGVMILIPKAQRSQGEVQIMLENNIGNVFEADLETRRAIDRCIFRVIRTFDQMGAEMVTCCEASRRLDAIELDQRLLYYFLPRHPDSPGAFSERQGRWVTGHYPEDFARSFKKTLEEKVEPLLSK